MCILSEINFFFQAEDGIRDCLLSRGLGDVYKRQLFDVPYKFLWDWVIFGRDMLFLKCTFWFVKIKRKIKQWQWRHFLLYFKEIYREHAKFGSKQSLKVTNCEPNHLLPWNNAFWAIEPCMASKTKKIWKNAKMRSFFNSGSVSYTHLTLPTILLV